MPTRSSHGARALPAVLLLVLALTALSATPAEANRRAQFPTQAPGNRGVNVTALQHLVRAKGQTVVVSGVFSRGTQAAVASFQRSAGLAVSGVVDAATWEKLVLTLDDGATGEAVLAAQELLNRKLGAGLPLSGRYDGATQDAVRSFQRRMGLPRTGVLDLPSWRYLLWHYVYPDFRNTNLCDYHSGNGRAANWGTASTVAQIEAAAALFWERTGLNVSVGELSWRQGGPLPGHSTHHLGLDVDLGLVRRDGRHCRRLGLDYRQAQYDRDATRELIKAIYEAAPGMVKLIYFNDPVLNREGLVVRYPNHHHHLHVRYCEVGHADRRYRCSAPALPSGSALQAALAEELNESSTFVLPRMMMPGRFVQRL